MKIPRGMKVNDLVIGTGRRCSPGDLAVCHYSCKRRKGDPVYSSDEEQQVTIRVGSRKCLVGLEYGLLGMQVGGKRTVVVPPHLCRVERVTFQLPDDAMLIYDIELIDLK